MGKQTTAMTLLKEDLIDCKKLSIESLSEVSDKTIRDATLKLITSIFSSIIERIDSELLPLERQQIEDAFVDSRITYKSNSIRNSEQYFNQTFK